MVFKWSGKRLACVPILAANMDTVGTFEMAKFVSVGAPCYRSLKLTVLLQGVRLRKVDRLRPQALHS